ncbi:MAG TPA: glycosyltransferase family 2 protein [Sphingomicrobium sp.]
MISVVIPTRNEAANVEKIAAAVIAQMETTGEPFDLIFIDNASADETVALVRAMCASDPRIRLIVNARNFGQMRSPTHAIYQAAGDAVIAMCADFQDPPALLPRFVERWRTGGPIILGVRQSEAGSVGLGLGRRFSYWFARRFADYPVIPDATGFGLYDRRVVETLKAIDEPEPFFRGMLVESGFKIETIPYPRPERAAGKSNNGFFALLDFALSGLAGSSKKLLRAPLYLGAGMAVLTGVALIVALLTRSWLWLGVAAVEAHFALLFLVLGLIADQVRLTTERTRKTPLVIEAERVNFPAGYGA